MLRKFRILETDTAKLQGEGYRLVRFLLRDSARCASTHIYIPDEVLLRNVGELAATHGVHRIPGEILSRNDDVGERAGPQTRSQTHGGSLRIRETALLGRRFGGDERVSPALFGQHRAVFRADETDGRDVTDGGVGRGGSRTHLTKCEDRETTH